MYLIVGLGNPGKKYQNTRHNAGWQAVDFLLEKKENWRKNKSANCFYFKKIFGEIETEIIKPLTYMNESGKSVAYFQKKQGLKPEQIVVIHDDFDLPLGTIRIAQNRSAAGHNGVKSIIEKLGTKEFIRIRIGVREERDCQIPAERLVMKNFSKTEAGLIKKSATICSEAIKDFLENGIKSAMNKYN